MSRVYKLMGEAYEINEDPTVYKTYEQAYNSIKDWEPFLGMTTDEALACEEVMIKEFDLE